MLSYKYNEIDKLMIMDALKTGSMNDMDTSTLTKKTLKFN
jgi:hypothetical protein